MPTYVLMTRLGNELMQDPSGRKRAGTEWKRLVAELCPEVKWIAHYALLGPYDFMDIYEAPDLETAHRVSYISRTAGALRAESWPAISYEDHLQVVRSVAEHKD